MRCNVLDEAFMNFNQLKCLSTATGQQSFAFHGPSVWNSLPSTLRDRSLSLRAFKGRLDTIFSVVNNDEHHPAALLGVL